MESWKPIPNYENLYEINTLGEVRSLCGRYGKNKILKACVNSRGYSLVTLCKDGKQKSFNVHRLVAELFIPNPDGLPCINHKDEDKTNNNVSNLEWCSYYYNNVYGQRLTKSAMKRSIPVVCVETGTVYASSQSAAQKTGICQSSISSCCNGKAKTAGGFHWRYHTKAGTSSPESHVS